MPFKTAMKLPVFLYGNIDLYILKGKVEFQNCVIKRGIIQMGKNKEYLSTVKGSSLFILDRDSKLIFNGKSEFSCNFLVRTGKGAQLTIGQDTFFGANTKLVCVKKITIGEQTRIGFESQIIDSNFHYTYNTEKRDLQPRDAEISIGTYNWIGNRTTISKGTTTNSFTIIANSSIVNKDYSGNVDPYVVLAGAPAKILTKNIRRVYDLELEYNLNEQFLKDEKIIDEDFINEIELSLKKLKNN
jgi:acetyltransferase-like isoleucine patch superfamily enzyme